MIKEFIKYIITGKGLFTAPSPQITIFARSALLDEDSNTVVTDPSQVNAHIIANIPDIEITPIPYNASWLRLDNEGQGMLSLLTISLQPESKGTIRLSSTDPRERPNCDLNFMSHEKDFKTMRKAVKLSLKIAEKIRENGYPLRDLLVPRSQSDDDLDDFVQRSSGMSTFHYSSTCRMAPETDKCPGVVDDELRVYGIKGLRIADASVFPNIPATHLQAPAVMVAERCAEFMTNSRK
jgi:choline dehydrogenase